MIFSFSSSLSTFFFLLLGYLWFSLTLSLSLLHSFSVYMIFPPLLSLFLSVFLCIWFSLFFSCLFLCVYDFLFLSLSFFVDMNFSPISLYYTSHSLFKMYFLYHINGIIIFLLMFFPLFLTNLIVARCQESHLVRSWSWSIFFWFFKC